MGHPTDRRVHHVRAVKTFRRVSSAPLAEPETGLWALLARGRPSYRASMELNRIGQLADTAQRLAESTMGFTNPLEEDGVQAQLQRADEALKAAVMQAVEAHARSASAHARSAHANKSATRYMKWTADDGCKLALKRSADANFRAASAHSRAAAARLQAALLAERRGNPALAEQHRAAAAADQEAAEAHMLAGQSDLQACTGTDGTPGI